MESTFCYIMRFGRVAAPNLPQMIKLDEYKLKTNIGFYWKSEFINNFSYSYHFLKQCCLGAPLGQPAAALERSTHVRTMYMCSTECTHHETISKYIFIAYICI